MRTGRMKRGFTLIETVVTVGIVAAMAAVVIPQVAKQFDTADPTRVQNDLKNIQTAIETYAVNVKTLPTDLDDLANVVTVGATPDSGFSSATSAALAGNENTLWNGPYIDQSITTGVTAADSATVPTGYGAKLHADFVCYDSGSNANRGVSVGTALSTLNTDKNCPTTTATGQFFVAMQITGIACDTGAGSNFMTLNALFDGTETSAATTGRIRCAAAGGTPATDVVVTYFLAVPIN